LVQKDENKQLFEKYLNFSLSRAPTPCLCG
jgi:hypothetical protein